MSIALSEVYGKSDGKKVEDEIKACRHINYMLTLRPILKLNSN